MLASSWFNFVFIISTLLVITTSASSDVRYNYHDVRNKNNDVKVNNTHQTVRMAVIAPADPSHEQSLVKILPAIMLAVRRVQGQNRLLSSVHIEVHHRDSQCSSTYGPLAAFQLYTHHHTGVFLGPVCDYVIAPVARYAGVWGVPVLTAGGQADAFHHKAGGHFPSLTRLMGSYSAIGQALQSILRQFGWSVAGLLYHNHGVGSARGHSLCHFALAAVFTALNSTPAHRSFDQETTSPLDYLDLLRGISQSARSESKTL